MSTLLRTRFYSALICMISLFVSSSVSAQTYATSPYSTGFESGSITSEWTTWSSVATGEIATFLTGTLTWSTQTAYSHTGNYFLGLHNSSPGGTYNTNQADLHLNLNGDTDLRLSIWWAEWNDETEAADGIFISDDDGVTFVKVLDLPGASYNDLQWYHFDMSLDSINTVHGLSFTSTYIIRLQQYDNYFFAGGNDGFLFDDIDIYSTCTASSSSMTQVVCDSYTVPSGSATYTTTGMYSDTLPNAVGCDSVITIDLIVNSADTTSITEIICDSYTAPDGATYTTSGQYVSMLQNANGCDSLINIDLTVNYSASSTITESAIGSYTAPSGAVYTTSGTYTDVIQTVDGCDSTITIILTVGYTGMDEQQLNPLRIYPNPSSGKVTVIGLEELAEISSVRLINTTGKVVRELEPGLSHLDFSNISNGVYYLEVNHAQGIERIRLIKQ